MFDNLALFIATTFYSGFLLQKISPRIKSGAGTIGSLIGMIISYFALSNDLALQFILMLATLTLVLGVITIPRAENVIMKRWGGLNNHRGDIVHHDFNQTNLDEVHGQLVATIPIFFCSDISHAHQLLMLAQSFVLFRFFDIFKPGPIKFIEDNLHGVWGVMLDDTAAGVFAAIIVILFNFGYF